jgi:hypothetical protein
VIPRQQISGGGEVTTVSIPCPECATAVHVEKSRYDDADELTLRCPNGHQFDYESPRGKTSMHAHKGWRFGLTATEQSGQWSARIELYQPGTAPKAHQPRLLPFSPTAPTAEEILARAMAQTKAEIDRLIGQSRGLGK